MEQDLLQWKHKLAQRASALKIITTESQRHGPSLGGAAWVDAYRKLNGIVLADVPLTIEALETLALDLCSIEKAVLNPAVISAAVRGMSKSYADHIDILIHELRSLKYQCLIQSRKLLKSIQNGVLHSEPNGEPRPYATHPLSRELVLRQQFCKKPSDLEIEKDRSLCEASRCCATSAANSLGLPVHPLQNIVYSFIPKTSNRGVAYSLAMPLARPIVYNLQAYTEPSLDASFYSCLSPMIIRHFAFEQAPESESRTQGGVLPRPGAAGGKDVVVSFGGSVVEMLLPGDAVPSFELTGLPRRRVLNYFAHHQLPIPAGTAAATAAATRKAPNLPLPAMPAGKVRTIEQWKKVSAPVLSNACGNYEACMQKEVWLTFLVTGQGKNVPLVALPPDKYSPPRTKES